MVVICITNLNLYPRHMLGLAGETGSEFVPGERKLKLKKYDHDCDCDCDDDRNCDKVGQDGQYHENIRNYKSRL